MDSASQLHLYVAIPEPLSSIVLFYKKLFDRNFNITEVIEPIGWIQLLKEGKQAAHTQDLVNQNILVTKMAPYVLCLNPGKT
jgi:hypothetical protein